MKRIVQSWRLGLLLLGRDWRSGELRLLGLSLVMAVAAMTSVGFFVDRLRSGLERDAAQLLGADLVLSADEPMTPSFAKEALRRGLAIAQTIVLNSMALAGEQTRLASIKAVSPGYPLRGILKVSEQPDAPETSTREIPSPGTVWAEINLLAQMGLQVGDQISLGEKSFRIERVLRSEPDRGLSLMAIGPRILMRLDDLEATQLIQPGSRETRRLLVAGPEGSVGAYQQWLKPQLARGQRLETLENGRPEVRSTLDRAQQFLSLVALLTAMLAAVAVALAARRFSLRHRDGCAVMRCMGMTQGELLHLYLSEFTAIGVVGSLVGIMVGFAAHFVFIVLLGSLIETRLPVPHLLTAGQGLLIGFVLLVGFALPPVLQLRHVPPGRVLRKDLGSPTLPVLFGYVAGAILFAALVIWTARDLRVGLYTAGGFAAAFILFSIVAWGVLRLIGRLRHYGSFSAATRFALASMERRPAATVVQTVSLSLGLMALILLSVTRNDLIADWRSAVPVDAPNRFVVNIQPEQRAPFAKRLAEEGIAGFDLAPMIRGRLVRINNAKVAPDQYQDDRAKRLVEREFNLSYRDTLPEHNRISAGHWLDGQGQELSIEEGIAKTLNLKLGDVLEFDIAGQLIEAPITSLRSLDWDSMRVNFFVIFPVKALQGMPQSWISAFYLPDQKIAVANRLVQEFSNITIIDTGVILRQIQVILDQVVTAVEFLFAFTLAAGILVLYAALLSSRDERTHEAAVLRVFGASRQQLTRVHVTELAGIGFLAGLLAASGAVATGWMLASRVFHFPYVMTLFPWVVGIGGGVIVAVVAGWMGLRSVLNQPTLVTLRDA